MQQNPGNLNALKSIQGIILPDGNKKILRKYILFNWSNYAYKGEGPNRTTRKAQYDTKTRH